MKKIVLIAASCIGFVSYVEAQDIIILRNMDEFEAKVEEIGHDAIKYRKWENLNGPIYSLLKEEVWMIIYENGIRERFPAPVHVLSEPLETLKGLDAPDDASLDLLYPGDDEAPAYPDYSDIDGVSYAPYRINIGFHPFEIGADAEFRIIPNFLNFGLSYLYQFPEDDWIVSFNHVNLYGSFYAPVNFLFGDYENKNRGFFPFVHLGYGISELVTMNYLETTTYYEDGFIWKVGLDYLFTPNFGVSLNSYQMENATLGIVFIF